MSTAMETPRGVDHIVLPVHGLKPARERLGKLGFTVAADALHPFGTENACVFFSDKTYLEPLAVASREACEEAARKGNVFVARDRAFRFRAPDGEGFSGIAVASTSAAADHDVYVEHGLSAGDILHFSRPLRLPDGTEATASFRLAFAADLRAPDFLLFSCERANPLPADRAALERHENGVTGISAVVLTEENPSDFQEMLETVFHQREIEAHSFGIVVPSANAKIEVLTPAGLAGYFGLDAQNAERGLVGAAIVFRTGDIGVTERLLAANGVRHAHKDGRLIVPREAGQGAHFVFEEV